MVNILLIIQDVLNLYGISPLTALIYFETKDLTTPTVTIKQDENQLF